MNLKNVVPTYILIKLRANKHVLFVLSFFFVFIRSVINVLELVIKYWSLN